MKTGVQSITIKLLDFEATESLNEIFNTPGAFHNIEIGEESEIEISGRKFSILKKEGEGKIEPWTQIILKIDASETSVNMVLALDTSYSMITTVEDTTRFDLAVDSIVSLIGQKTKNLMVGIMTYGVDWEMSLDMTNAKSFTKKKLSQIGKELRSTKHKGKAAAGTALNGALEIFTVKELNDIRAVILLSDGADEIGPNPLKEAEKLISRGIYIYPFYFGEETDQKSLTIFKRIADMSHTKLFSLYNAVEEEKRHLIRASLKIATEEDNKGEEPEESHEPKEVEKENEGDTDSKSDEGKEELVVPTGSELLIRKLSELGLSLTLVIQERGERFEPDEDGDVQVIKAGIPVEEEEHKESGKPTFKRTPKIIDAIKNFIEWLKSLFW